MAGDGHDVFRALYAKHYPAVLGYFLRRAGRDQAQDLAADVFAVAWRKRQTMPDDEFVLPWLYAIASRTLANHRRTQRRQSSLREKMRGLARSTEPGPDVQVVRRSEDEGVLRAVERLRPNDRATILLSAWEGLSAPQIATVMDITVAAAEKRLTRAKQRLASELRRVDGRGAQVDEAAGGGRR